MAGYPVILGGDHAAFEAEWAASGRPDHERPDWPLPSFDARDWATSFRKIATDLGCSDMDEGWLTTWFAGALMRGYDQRTAELMDDPLASTARELLAALIEVKTVPLPPHITDIVYAAIAKATATQPQEPAGSPR